MQNPKSIPAKIKAFNADRDPHYLRQKYDAMYSDKYRFFRATTHLFFEDISSKSFLRQSPNAWICGDMHLENFGSYKGDNRLAHFSLNDFDEAILAPCLFDPVRLITSIFVASESIGLSSSQAKALSGLFIDNYFEALRQGYIRVLQKDSTRGIMRTFLEDIANRKRKNFLNKKTELKKRKNKRKLIIDNIHASAISSEEKEKVIHYFEKASRSFNNPNFYEVKDVAHRIAGTSSLGLKRYILLVEGNGSPNENYLLDLKETRPSCVAPYTNVLQPEWQSEAERIIEVQQRVLADPPALLNSVNISNCNFVLKELQPSADRINYNLFEGNKEKFNELLGYMAQISAWGVIRSSGRQGSSIADELILFASDAKGLKQELIAYATSYAKVIHSYYQEYSKAFQKGYFSNE